MSIVEYSSCVSSSCTATFIGTSYYYYETTCPSDAKSYAASTYGDTKYLLVDVFSDTECSTYTGTAVIVASGTCEVVGTTGQGVITTVFSNGSAQFQNFLDTSCTVSSSSQYTISKDLLTTHSCFQGFKLYSNADGSTSEGISGTSSSSGAVGTSSTSSGSNTGIIIGVAAGVVVLLLLAGLLCWRCRRNKNKQEIQQIQVPDEEPTDQFYPAPVTPQKTGTASTTLASSDGLPSKLWDDEAIIAARIPREKVVVERLVNRGGFGEVHAGTYNGQRVAIKMLLPERKKSLTQVNAFLSEVKLMSTLDHAHIVAFIGVAWDSLTDLCVVTEFMVIDLKALLSKYEKQRLPTGFDHDKVKVALHVAHALTYLHSCAPPVIHRDLKSSNILLNEQMDAKVTDFGISRERIDATMTAGVGTSLWMAPEVMLGERYDDKADMFSFGVVLSELDQHTLPYSQAKNNSHSGQRLTDTAILQMVAAGKLRVEFSQAAPESIVELGHACVSTDPKDRPTAAEALYRLQTILTREITYYTATSCPSSIYEHTADFYDDTSYLLVDIYSGTDCTTYVESAAFAASGDCEVAGTDGQSVIASLNSNGSAQLTYYLDGSSSTSSASGSSSSTSTSDSSSGISGGAIAGIIVGALFVLAIVGVLIYRRKQRRPNQGNSPPDFGQTTDLRDAYHAQGSPAKRHRQTTTTSISDSDRHHQSTTKLWDDDVIVGSRIPREKVKILKLLNRGGYGEVYIGSYHGKQVAVKMLLPETKKTMSQVNAFLSEVKLMASLDHPRIVSFIGVAWDQLIDICVISEYMAGGDLKALLTEYDQQGHPVGFDHNKVKIAFHVSIALTYLHSCAPPVIHRDLKSKNILLDESMNAKVTDFGISRERIDATMTGGIGTSFWMAPEVMMGERYDDKADMFSFGVVLSELDSHVMPYALSKSNSSTESSSDKPNKLPNAAILQMVAAGRLRVHFSEAGPQSMIDLGLACVSLDPNERPTAAEALYKLQQILSKEV
ncbi:TKL/DRK protein kinase [Phytophthora megakarya]|uniref:TKL/DRK protein kinase n=1 Tax=Phytophthora megakarya TaxID=4795 RepID=A0A225W2S7_9STRA|nr:TKL/DRK protein kinase [Phytophthora megakarya]